MAEPPDSVGNPLADDASEYLQMFLDETEEQLDDLVETLLSLERNPDDRAELNEAFRLIHSIKGAAGMMGFDNITVLTHQLENRFERFRSGVQPLDRPTINLVLRCIDFLRDCTRRLRHGEHLATANELLEELRALEQQPMPSESPAPKPPAAPVQEGLAEGQCELTIQFEPGLPLADLKAQLIVARLSERGQVVSTYPPLEALEEWPELASFQVRLETDQDPDSLRSLAEVDGVQSVGVTGTARATSLEVPSPANEADYREASEKDAQPRADRAGETVEPSQEPPPQPSGEPTVESDSPELHQPASPGAPTSLPDEAAPEKVPLEPHISPPPPTGPAQGVDDPGIPSPLTASQPAGDTPKARVLETMRVDIDRLDDLMNLVGELVVNRARFVQVARQVRLGGGRSSTWHRTRELADTVSQTIEDLRRQSSLSENGQQRILGLQTGLSVLDELYEFWEHHRRCFAQISETIDQLTRISDSLQRAVLETRMVPVGPLFNRFKRVVRDLADDCGKQVNLVIRGEKTELDKRMIDELADPLTHLIRNAIDHGLERPDVREASGKPATGTIWLEASHTGNNVYVHIRDDGGGIAVDRIKNRLRDRGLVSSDALAALADDQVIDYIWHPGFSTASKVTDLSGRGVGMDIVRTRINELNGTIDVRSEPFQGTQFSIRLPLTLAIINSLLVRMRTVIFSIPIDDVREIVLVNRRDVVTVLGKETFEVRREFIPLVTIDEVFNWSDTQRTDSCSSGGLAEPSGNVVILQTAGKTMGLRVDELLGGQEVVIKSLSENFVPIRGLSGASILGDGTVCLMLDVGASIDLATQRLAHRSGGLRE